MTVFQHLYIQHSLGWFFKERDDMKYEEMKKYETEKVVSIR